MIYSRTRARLVLVVTLLSLNARAATSPADLHLFDRHVKIERGEARVLGQVIAALEFSSIVDFDDPNGEFVYFEEAPGPAKHSSVFLLTDPTVPGLAEFLGELGLVVPVEVDDDADGIPDFYQVANALNAVTQDGWFVVYAPGDPNTALDAGPVEVRWTRAAGEARGTCVITLSGEEVILSPLAFTHVFEIAEYAGTCVYVPATDAVLGEIDVTRVGKPDQRFQGALVLELWPGQLSIDGGEILSSVWTNALGRTISVDYGYLDRDSEYPVEYFGELLWSEVDHPSSELFGFGTFFIGIHDPNDFDADGIPDLTDPPPAAAGPRLVVSRAGEGLALEITGELDQTFELRTASALTAMPAWTLVETITLTNSPQTVLLPAPTASAAYWRLMRTP